MRLIYRAAALAAAAFSLIALTACDPQRISELKEGVSTEADVRDRFGAPENVWDEPGGARTFEYNRQPAGQVNYMITIGPDGRMTALRQVLTKVNPNIRIDTIYGKVTPDVVPTWLGGFPIVCEAFDKADQKAMLVTTVRRTLPEAIVVSGNGMAGCGHNELMKTRKLAPNFYMCGDGVTGPKPGAGLMAPRVALCAAQMANVVTALILGEDVGAV